MVRRQLYYGWIIVWALAVTETVSWGALYYTFPVFLQPMEEEFGWSRSEVTGAYSLGLLVAALAAVPVGWWLDRRGPRGLMTAGSCAGVVLVIAWAHVQSVPALYAVWAGIGLVMAAVLYEPAFAVVVAWFGRLRDRALTIVTLVAGLASTIFVPLAHALLQRYGWRGALLVLAGILACTTIPIHALVLRRRPADLGLERDGAVLDSAGCTVDLTQGLSLLAAIRTVAFWSLALSFVLASLATTAVVVHLIPYLTEQGYAGGTAAMTLGVMGAMQLPGRLLFAVAGRYCPYAWITPSIFLMQAVAVSCLWLVPGVAGLVVFTTLFGMGNGMSTLARAANVFQLFGQAHYGSVSGAVAMWATAARAVGPVGAALLYGAAAGYEPVLAVVVVTLLMASVGARVAHRSAPSGRSCRSLG